MHRYIPVAIYIVGLYYHGSKVPIKTVEVFGDNYVRALNDGYRMLMPTTVQRVRIIECNVNPDYLISMNKIHGPYQYLRTIEE